MTLRAIDRHPLCGLYAVTPDCADSARLLVDVAAALAGGCRIVQYRNKTAAPGFRRQQATALATYCRSAGVMLIVNDDIELAIEVGATGVHLGGDDGDLKLARAQLGASRLLGVSCYNDPAQVRHAVAAGADYVALGAMFPSTTKPLARRASLDLLREVKAACPIPVATIGGINLDNAAALVAAGADMVAVVSDLFDSPDIESRARAYQKLFNS
jgi:thiamine-phosphate pyrophosphorylase